MTACPAVSVVMAVYNGAPHLSATIDSVLSQAGVELEFIIVDDGSSDGTPALLDSYAKRARNVRIIRQSNAGLTKALIAGCNVARGEFIARQDVGDISVPGRLRKQLDCAREHPEAGLVSCGTRFVGPAGEHLYDVQLDPKDIERGLLGLDLRSIKGPSHHGSAFYSRALYERVGGYRPEFYFAQDLDLWIRLTECGPHVQVAEILYQARFTVASISGQYRREQIKTTELIIKSAQLRREGVPECSVLKGMPIVRPGANSTPTRQTQARALYFIGSCLRKRRDPAARAYFRRAIQAFPLHLRSWVRALFG